MAFSTSRCLSSSNFFLYLTSLVFVRRPILSYVGGGLLDRSFVGGTTSLIFIFCVISSIRSWRAYASICSGVMVEVRAVTIPIKPRILFSLAEDSVPHLFLRLRERAPSRSWTLRGPRGTLGRLLNSAGDSLLLSSLKPLRGPRGMLFVPVMEPLFRHAMMLDQLMVEGWMEATRRFSFPGRRTKRKDDVSTGEMSCLRESRSQGE